jgi:hypothetical protein
MKESKHIIFRLLFLITVLLCLGLEVYTYYNTTVCNTELSSEINCEQKNVFSIVDSFDHDPIIKVSEPSYLVEQKVLILISNDLFLLTNFSFPSWQPPKYS